MFCSIRLMLVCAFSFLPFAAWAEEFAGIKLDKGVTYSRIGRNQNLCMDIASPTAKGVYPAVICVHGGAWRMGNREEMQRWIELLASEGYVAASISYRLIPEAHFPDPIADCKTAVRFLRANAEKFQIDANKIGAIGYSAGGHLVCLLGTTNKSAGFDGSEYPEQSSRVQAVVSYFGPTNLEFYGNDESAQNAIFEPLLGARYKDKPELYRKASPLSYVSKDAPPFLFLHGTKDWLVPIEQSRQMNRKLKELGVKSQVVEIEGASHGFTGADNRRTTEATLKFLAETLKK